MYLALKIFKNKSCSKKLVNFYLHPIEKFASHSKNVCYVLSAMISKKCVFYFDKRLSD